MMMKKMCPVHKVAYLLMWVGALNWGLVAISPSYNVVALLGDTVARIVYALVGLSALAMIMHGKCKQCMMAGEGKAAGGQPMGGDMPKA